MAAVGGRQPLAGVDRAILLIDQSAVRDGTRLQKYAFLASQLHRAELEPLGFYSDWRPYYYGPYSSDFAYDLHEAHRLGLVRFEPREIDGCAVTSCNLGPEGAKKLSRLMNTHEDLIKRMRETFANLDKKTLDEILDELYEKYPEHAKNSKMAVAAGVPLDPGDDVRLNPETERLLEEIESGNANWKTYSIPEYIEHVNRLVRD